MIERSRRLVSALGLLACVMCSGYSVSSIDPTEASFDVKVKNDLSRSVTLVQCRDGRCHDLGDLQRVAPGRVTIVGAATDAANWYVVRGGGATLGCLELRLGAKPPSAPIVLVSRATTCP